MFQGLGFAHGPWLQSPNRNRAPEASANPRFISAGLLNAFGPGFNKSLNAVPSPENAATRKLLESESCVQCPAGHGQHVYSSVGMSGTIINVGPTMFNGIVYCLF